MLHNFDVVIVGGGMVGGALALALSSSDYRVAVIEARENFTAPANKATQRAIAVSWGSRCLLEQMGLWQTMREHAMPIHHIHVSDRGHFGKTRLSAAHENVDALGYVIAAEIIEQNIEKALQQTNVTFFQPYQLSSFEQQENDVVIQIESGQKTHTLTARVLVGADGAGSSVKTQGGFQTEVFDYEQSAITVNVTVQAKQHDVAFERFTAKGPIALLPHFDGQYSVVWTQPSEDAKTIRLLNEHELTEQLQDTFGDWLGELRLASAPQCFPLTLSYVQEAVSGRVVLIGNAAHQLHPVAGQGFNLGLRDAAMLSDMLCHHDVSQTVDCVLAQYQAHRLKDQSSTRLLTNGLVQLFSNDNVLLSALRNAGLVVLDKTPALKTKFAQHAMGLSSRLARVGEVS